jgi:hypothetical protein
MTIHSSTPGKQTLACFKKSTRTIAVSMIKVNWYKKMITLINLRIQILLRVRKIKLQKITKKFRRKILFLAKSHSERTPQISRQLPRKYKDGAKSIPASTPSQMEPFLKLTISEILTDTISLEMFEIKGLVDRATPWLSFKLSSLVLSTNSLILVLLQLNLLLHSLCLCAIIWLKVAVAGSLFSMDTLLNTAI